MAFRASGVALLLASLSIVGCGTVANLFFTPTPQGGVSPFGGVRHDLACIDNAADGGSGCKAHPPSESEQYRQAAHTVLCAADLPLSLVGDIVTWPYTAAYTFINSPVPVPPMTPAPNLAPTQTLGQRVTQEPAEAQPKTPELETLPQPKTLPEKGVPPESPKGPKSVP